MGCGNTLSHFILNQGWLDIMVATQQLDDHLMSQQQLLQQLSYQMPAILG
jgi:hypothetical protein